MDFRHLIVTCLFSMLRLSFETQKIKENYAIFIGKRTQFFICRCLKQTVVLSTNPYQSFLIFDYPHHMTHIRINPFDSFLTNIIATKSFAQAYPQDSMRVFI